MIFELQKMPTMVNLISVCSAITVATLYQVTVFIPALNTDAHGDDSGK
jgi:hypothetical protein